MLRYVENAQTPLEPTLDQHRALLATMHRFNAACTWIATQAHRTRTTNKLALQKLVYYAVRDQFGLSAQLTIRAIAKVAEVYKRDATKLPRFRPHGAVVYDERVLSFAAAWGSASILTLGGRSRVPVHVCAYHATVLHQATVRGQADLVYQQGHWYVLLVVAVPDPACASGNDFLGVDLGIINLATDSDGSLYSGARVERTRRILAHRRRNLQRYMTGPCHDLLALPFPPPPAGNHGPAAPPRRDPVARPALESRAPAAGIHSGAGGPA